MAKKVNITTLRENVGKLLDDMTRSGELVIITERSHPVAVIVSIRTFRAMQKRLDELEEEQLRRTIREGRKEHRKGLTRRIASLRELR